MVKTTLSIVMIFITSIAFTQNSNSNPNANTQGNWRLNGNTSNTAEFIGTTNQIDLVFKSNNIEGFRLNPSAEAKFLGNVYLDKLKIITGPPKERFLQIDNDGKITSLDKSGLVDAIYQPPTTCKIDLNGNVLSVWKQVPNPNYGILFSGVDCPVRVGIGTNNPLAKLDVIGGAFFSGSVGIGTTTLTAKVNIISNFANGLVVETNQTSNYGYGIQSKVSKNLTKAYAVYNAENNEESFVVYGNGNVYATKILVRTTPFPDYVFNSDYQLMPLMELEAYIKENKHLPNMPTADEVEENGADLGEINRVLVEKTEELTLYIIALKKEFDSLKEEVEKLK